MFEKWKASIFSDEIIELILNYVKFTKPQFSKFMKPIVSINLIFSNKKRLKELSLIVEYKINDIFYNRLLYWLNSEYIC